MSNNSQKTNQVTFPENSPQIISELLEKYNLEETPGDLWEKLKKGESPHGGIIADVVVEIAKGKIKKDDLVPTLQERLNLPKPTARNLARDIEKKLLAPAEKILKPEEFSTPTKETQFPEKRKKEDIYREPIE